MTGLETESPAASTRLDRCIVEYLLREVYRTVDIYIYIYIYTFQYMIIMYVILYIGIHMKYNTIFLTAIYRV